MTIASRAWSSSAGNKVLLWLIQAILTLLLMIAFSLFPPHFQFSSYYPFQIPSSPSHQRMRKKTLYISLSISCSFSLLHSTTPPHTHPPTFHTILSPNWQIAEQYFTHRAACDSLPASNGNIPAVDLLLGYAWNAAGRPAASPPDCVSVLQKHNQTKINFMDSELVLSILHLHIMLR